jgi:predicted nucleotidyltransferase
MTGRRLHRYVAEKERLLKRIRQALEADPRVVAAWLSGSFGRGEGDAWADYDLHVVVRDEDLLSFLADRSTLYASIGEVALIQDDIPGQPPVQDRFHLVHFSTLHGPVEVDWSYLPATEARKPGAHLPLFEKQPIPTSEAAPLSHDERSAEARRWSMFFWAMAPIAARLCGRGDLERAVVQVRLLQRALICLWRLLDEEHGPLPWDPDANRPLEASLDARLPRLGNPLQLSEVLETVEASCRLAESLLEPLRALSAAVDPLIIGQTLEMVITARESVEQARFPARRYR